MMSDFYHKPRYVFTALVVFILTLMIHQFPAAAGEPPGGVIGPMNPTMYTCREGDGSQEAYQPDPFIKEYAYRFVPGGRMIGFDETDTNGDFYFEGGPALLDPNFRDEEFVRVFGTRSEDGDGNTTFDDEIEHYNPQLATCDSKLWVDFGFNNRDAVEYENYLYQLDDACSDAGGTLMPIEETLINGYVYEFHQRGNGEWLAVPSQDVPVHLNGITFDLEWGSDTNGYYYFDHLGAGPMVLNLRLPPDAHPINPNVALFSSGLDSGKPEGFPSFTVFLGFYRGDNRPEDVTLLRTPGGNALPFSSPSTIDTLRECGYLGHPGAQQMPAEVLDMSLGMPYVGGPPKPTDSTGILLVSVLLVVGLFTAGGITLYHTRR